MYIACHQDLHHKNFAFLATTNFAFRKEARWPWVRCLCRRILTLCTTWKARHDDWRRGIETAFRGGRQGALWQAKASVGPYDGRVGLFSRCRGESSIQVSPRRWQQHATSVGDRRHLVYAEHAPSDYNHSAVVYNEIISVEEEANLVADLQEIF
jgi:hypothetical protein